MPVTLAGQPEPVIQDVLNQLRSLPLTLGGVFGAPAANRSLLEAEARCGLAFPEDLRTMLRMFNGTTGPTDLDHGWLTFWPAEELEPASGRTAGYKAHGHLIVFADHGVNSWWYGIECAREDGQ